jgi:hypothetical protein
VTRLCYYVYYRVAPGVDVAARDRVRAAQAEIRAALAIAVRLLTKRDEPELWMEVYEGVTDADGFERMLAASVERHALAQLLRPGTVRKTECFVVPACA